MKNVKELPLSERVDAIITWCESVDSWVAGTDEYLLKTADIRKQYYEADRKLDEENEKRFEHALLRDQQLFCALVAVLFALIYHIVVAH